MTTLELLVRGGAVATALILALALATARHATRPSRYFGAGLCLGVASYLLCSGTVAICSSSRALPTVMLASAVPFLFWGWTASVMDDDFRVSPWALAGAVLLVAVALLGVAEVISTVGVVIHSVLGLAFVLAALFTVVRGWREDLVESRRTLRWIVLLVAGTYSAIILIVELILGAQPPAQWLLVLNAALLAMLLFAIAGTVLALSTSASSAFGRVPAELSPIVEPAPPVVRDREQELIGRLQNLMTRDAKYRDPAVSITLLASKLGVSEKKLRELINQRLGFRNFPSYVNAFRLEEVRLRLLDDTQASIPILTMALEAGFGSIVAFNRAFKARYGTTPTAFRDEAPDTQRGAGSPSVST